MELPHVTDILRNAGMVPTGPWFDEEALERGTALHAARHLSDLGTLDETSVDPQIAGKLKQYDRFKRDMGDRYSVIQSEAFVEHAEFGYCGTADIICEIDSVNSVIDIKPSEAPWHGPQLAAYAEAAGVGQRNRWNLILTPERYFLSRRHQRSDWTVFLAALSIYTWRLKHGLVQEAQRR